MRSSITPEEFVRIWQQASCVRDVCEKTGLNPSAARGRARQYREKGIALLYLPRIDSRALDVDALNDLAKSLSKGARP